MGKLKVGIVGYGNISNRRHIPSYKKDSRVEITSIIGPDINKAQKTAQKHKIKYHFDNLEKMLKLDLDIISICTPPGTHSEIAIKALESGCHVLVEKPMAMNTKEANDMAKASEKYGRNLCVVHNFLFSNSMLAVRKMLKDGKMGAIQDVSAFQLSSNMRDLPVWFSSLPGKLFFDEVPHMIYSLGEFIPNLGVKDILKVAIAKSYPADNFYIDFSSNNVIASLKMIFNAPCSEWKIAVVGTERVAIIDLFRDSVIILSPEKSHLPTEVLSSSLKFISQFMYNDLDSGFRLIQGNLLFGHDRLIKLFIDSIYEGISPPITPELGKNVVEISEHILEKVELYESVNCDNEYYRLRI